MKKSIEKMGKNPLQVLDDKLRNIYYKLCDEKAEIDVNQNIYGLANDLFHMSLSLQEELYKEMLKEFPEIKNVTLDELTDYERESKKFWNTYDVVEYYNE